MFGRRRREEAAAADAGDGGVICVLVDDADTYLLMAVEGVDGPDARVKGGAGRAMLSK